MMRVIDPEPDPLPGGMHSCCAAGMKKARRKSPRLFKICLRAHRLGELGTLVRPPSGTRGADGSGGAEVDRLRAFAHAVRLDVEGDLLAVDERAQARCLDRGNMDEHVLGAA